MLSERTSAATDIEKIRAHSEETQLRARQEHDERMAAKKHEQDMALANLKQETQLKRDAERNAHELRMQEGQRALLIEILREVKK